MPIAPLLLVLALILWGPAPASAQPAPPGPVWDEAAICRAAVQTYFFLPAPPRPLGLEGTYLIWRSAAGNRYDCRIVAQRAHLRWTNGAGERMTSQSTRTRLTGQGLIVVTDMGRRAFAGIP